MMTASFWPFSKRPFSSMRLISASGALPMSAGRYMGTCSERDDFTSIDCPRQIWAKKSAVENMAKERTGQIRKRKHRRLQDEKSFVRQRRTRSLLESCAPPGGGENTRSKHPWSG